MSGMDLRHAGVAPVHLAKLIWFVDGFNHSLWVLQSPLAVMNCRYRRWVQ